MSFGDSETRMLVLFNLRLPCYYLSNRWLSCTIQRLPSANLDQNKKSELFSFISTINITLLHVQRLANKITHSFLIDELLLFCVELQP